MASSNSKIITAEQQSQIHAFLCKFQMPAYSLLYHGKKRRNSHIDLDIGWRAETEVNHPPKFYVEIDGEFQRMLNDIKQKKR